MNGSARLAGLLRGTRFESFLEINRHGVQLPSWIATLCGLKPAMDLWVLRDSVEIFKAVASKCGLIYHIDCYFDRHCEAALRNVPSNLFTTTRAALSHPPTALSEAHVFVSHSRRGLQEAVANGWYPLVIDGVLVDKHLSDHGPFGRALGYPPCCNEFFLGWNNWQKDNHYYTSFRSTSAAPCWLSNSLLRHTAYSLASHIACSFSCCATQRYAARLFESINAEAPAYAAEIQRNLRRPILCLSEIQIYIFEGALEGTGLFYSKVDPVNPTRHDDDLCALLRQGDQCVVDANVIKVLRAGRQIATYFARADKYAPEFPFVVQCE